MNPTDSKFVACSKDSRFRDGFYRGVAGLRLVLLASGCSPPRTPAKNGYLVALDLNSGHQLWKVDLSMVAMGPPAVFGDVLVVEGGGGCGGNGSTIGVSASTGKTLWKGPGSGYCIPAGEAPARAGGSAIVVDSGNLLALDPATGAQRWKRALGSSGDIRVGASEKVVIAAGNDSGVAAFDAVTGSSLWNVKPIHERVGPPPSPGVARTEVGFSPLPLMEPVVGSGAAYMFFGNIP
ncbi:MAG: PQQ-like beta-propeller repeat protein, partial [Actinomycetota bacterium]|nr:PQQ-like beta-propeller repeat protein [Actinomycetota bacterium]